MSLVTTKELLLDAQKNGYAVGAFNVENMEMVQAVVAAAEELKSPVIMQTTPSTIKYASPEMFYDRPGRFRLYQETARKIAYSAFQ